MTQEVTTLPTVIRNEVEVRKDYHKYLNELRFDFYYSCAYCSIMEQEACGIRFEIDHYYPQSKYPELKSDYRNLMYSCEKCNKLKNNFAPDDTQLSKGYVIIRPDEDHPSNHFEVKGVLLKGTTPTGEFNIDWLNLNRLQLRKLREIRRKLSKSIEFIAFGLKLLASARIDRLKPNERVVILNIISQFKKRQLQITNSFDELTEKIAKSGLLDEDPEKKMQLARRKKYLKEQKAIGIDLLK